MVQTRQPAGVPVGGQFATSHHEEAATTLASAHMDRFVVHREPPGQILAIGRLLGAAETAKPGMSWSWWAQQHWEAVGPDERLLTAQQDLRGDHHVDDYRTLIRGSGPEAMCPPPPTELELDSIEAENGLDVNNWPHLVRTGGQMWVVDGHHRLAAAAAEGQSLNVIVADLDAQADRLSQEDPWDMPDNAERMLDHITEGHMLENDMFGDPDIVEDETDADGVERVTYEQLAAWHDEAHELGLADHRHV